MFKIDQDLLARCSRIVKGDYTAHEFNRYKCNYEFSVKYYNMTPEQRVRDHPYHSNVSTPESYERSLRSFLATGQIGSNKAVDPEPFTPVELQLKDRVWIRKCDLAPTGTIGVVDENRSGIYKVVYIDCYTAKPRELWGPCHYFERIPSV